MSKLTKQLLLKDNLRHKNIQPFYVMDILGKAKEMEIDGADIIHLEIGEPDFSTPPMIQQAGIQAIESGKTFYTASLGLPNLRQKISAHYKQKFDLEIDYQRIVITSGASGALLLVLGALLNPNDVLIMADPSYPCNANFAHFLTVTINRVSVDSDTNFQLTAELIEQNWDPSTKAVIIASPANPTGTLVAEEELIKIIELVKIKQGFLIVDEIYHQLVYDIAPKTALSLSNELIVINSFSKYFQMTGWRLGWSVVPKGMIDTMDKLSQNLFLSASSPAQYAALEAFNPDTLELLEERREELRERRNYFVEGLLKLGFKVPAKPQGAFYIYADCSMFSNNSKDFCLNLLEQSHVAVTPGNDFGEHRASQYIRFSYTQSKTRLKEALKRVQAFLLENKKA